MRRPEGEADPVHHRPVGTILNPTDHQGQIEGGVMQGIGFALMEELKYEEGWVSTLTLGEYKIPTM